VRRHQPLVGACIGAFVLGAIGLLSPAMAQAPSSGPPNALQGFSQNRDQPVQIDAATLEVRDKDKIATFLGNVRMVQGDTTMRCKTLLVFYDQDATPGTLTAAKPGPGGQQQIKRLEAKGGVLVTQKDQTATGDSGVFDMKANTVTLIGGVVVTQGQNVLRGERLVVDLTTGVSRIEADKGRVQGLFLPSNAPETKPAETKPAKCSGPACAGNQSAGATNTSAVGREPPRAHPTGPSGLY
jgi:lipopolysaccharide export system protein LptA